MSENNRPLTLTVGIPTCYGGASLVDTVKSLRACRGVAPFRLVIVADRTPISEAVKREILELGAELHWNEVEGSQMKKVKQMIATLETDIFVHTQDDITFHPDALAEIVRAFAADPAITMVGSRVLPLPPLTRFEGAMASMVRLVDRIGRRWQGGDNRLLASGRCLSYRVSHLRGLAIPEQIVNSDIYMYLLNQQSGGRFSASAQSIVYIRCPQRFGDQIGPSSRFQFQKEEIAEYLGASSLRDYAIPIRALIWGFLEEFFSHPAALIWYLGIFALTRFKKLPRKTVRDPVWGIDQSTKQVK